MKTYTAPDRQRIAGVQTKVLRPIPDERGWLMEILRRDETELLPKFGQVYVSGSATRQFTFTNTGNRAADAVQASVSGSAALTLESNSCGTANALSIKKAEPPPMRIALSVTIPLRSC